VDDGPALSSASAGFFLGWQNQLEEVRLKVREIRYWITAKAPAKGPLLTAGLPFLPQHLPGTDVLRNEFGCGVRMQSCGSCGNHTDGATEDESRGSRFAPCRTPFMIAIRPEKLFQIIISPGQPRHGIAGEEARPVTAGNLPEVHQRRFQCPRGALVSGHRAQESPEATLHRQRLTLVMVAEDMSRLMDPVISCPYVGPQSSGVR
jgi:hypothetical protein